MFKKTISQLLTFLAITLFTTISCSTKFSVDQLQEGDLIFQETDSTQARALVAATSSRWTHVGLFFRYNKRPFVFEAVQPVRITSLNRFLARSKNGKFAVKRLRSSEKLLTTKNIKLLKQTAKKYLGLNYDLQFRWTNQKIYCSEVVWKIFNTVFKIKIGELRKFSTLNLSHPRVRQLIKKRYSKGFPMNELVITPGDMFDSPLLKSIY